MLMGIQDSGFNNLTDPVHPGGHICLAVSSKVVDSLWGLDVKHELVGHTARLVGESRVNLMIMIMMRKLYSDDDQMVAHLLALVEVNNTFQFSRLRQQRPCQGGARHT